MRTSPIGKWEKLPSGDQGVYSDYILKFGGIQAFISEQNAPHGGYSGGGRCYAKDKPPISQWQAKVGIYVLPYNAQNWDYPTLEAAQIACEDALVKIANQILAALTKKP